MTTLAAWLWQGTALALGALVVLRAMRALDAATRHALWWGVLASVLALPWLPSLVPLARPAMSQPEVATSVSTASGAPLVLPVPPDWLVAIALGVWLGTVVLGALRIARGVAFVRRVQRSAQPIDPARERCLRLWTTTPRRRPVALRVSPLVRTACAVGLGRATVVVPPWLLEAIDDDALDGIVMHERAHLERYDDVWRLVEACIDAVAGLHPGVRIALTRIDLEREAACDDRVVLQTGSAERYAVSLADAASVPSAPRPVRIPDLLPGAVGRPTVLAARVARLLDPSQRHRARLMPAATFAGVVLIGTMASAASLLDPVVAFEAKVLDALAPVMSTERASRAPETPASAHAPATRRVPVRVVRATAPPTGDPARRPAATAEPDIPGAPEPSAAGDPPVASEPVVLASRPVAVPVAAAFAAPGGTRPQIGSQAVSSPSPWTAAADGGAAIGDAARRGGVTLGSGARKAGTAVAGFFARTGRAVARSF